MPGINASAVDVVDALYEQRNEAELEKIRKRLAPDEQAFGVRMRYLFDTAKSYTDLPLQDVHTLLDHPAYEPRLAALCILDFKARRRLEADRRRQLCDIYVDRHDRITTWDMVDRAAPRVVGGYLVGRPADLLHGLADAAEPLRRRTAVTAPLYFVRNGSDADVAAGFAVAARLARDPEPVVHNAVGIFLKHAGTRNPERLHEFLTAHAPSMPRAAVRLAVEKLNATERANYVR